MYTAAEMITNWLKRKLVDDPKSLQAQCLDLMCTMYYEHFKRYNETLPSTLKKRLITMLLENDDEKWFYTENYDVFETKDWFNISEKDFVRLLYCDRKTLMFDDETTLNIIWYENNRECRSCNPNAERYTESKSNLISCNECGYNKIIGDITDYDTFVDTLFDPNNWCSKCYVKPLFTFVECEDRCAVCDDIEKYGCEYVDASIKKQKFYMMYNNE
jgi:hypothetical protein